MLFEMRFFVWPPGQNLEFSPYILRSRAVSTRSSVNSLKFEKTTWSQHAPAYVKFYHDFIRFFPPRLEPKNLPASVGSIGPFRLTT